MHQLYHHVIRLHELTWQTCYPKRSHVHQLENKLKCSTEWVFKLFSHHHCMKVPVYWIQSCFTICVAQFVNHSCLTWMQLAQTNLLSDWDKTCCSRTSHFANCLSIWSRTSRILLSVFTRYLFQQAYLLCITYKILKATIRLAHSPLRNTAANWARLYEIQRLTESD